MNDIIGSATLKEAFSRKIYYLMCFSKSYFNNEKEVGSQFNI